MRVLCYGDSLTSGWMAGGWESAPYCEYVDGKNGIQSVSTGYPGYTVPQLAREFDKALAKDGGPWDVVVVLGGTNDLAFESSAGEIFAQLSKMYDKAMSGGAEVVAVTVPPLKTEPEGGLPLRRGKLNGMIRAWGTAGGRRVVDFFRELDEAPNRNDLFDDNIHMNRAGYALLGRSVLAALSAPS